MKGLKIIKTSRYTPKKVVTNDEIKKFVETDDEWISSRTGIKTRCFAENQTNIDLAVEVAKQLIEDVDTTDIIGVIVATFTPDYYTPSMACMVQKKAGLNQNVIAFDMNAACSGFIYGLQVAKGLLLQNPTKKILLIGSEKISRYLDFTDRNTCVLFGDGAGGVLIGLQDNVEDLFAFQSIGNDEAIYCGPESNNYLSMNGKEVFVFAVNAVMEGITKILKQSGLTIDEIDYIVCHQANFRIISHVYKKMGISKDKFYINLDKYGNTSSASIPIALDEMSEKGMLKQGDKVILVGFGAGLTWGSTLITW